MVQKILFLRTMAGFGQLSPVLPLMDRNFPSSNLSLVPPGRSDSNGAVVEENVNFAGIPGKGNTLSASLWSHAIQRWSTVYLRRLTANTLLLRDKWRHTNHHVFQRCHERY